MSPDPINSRLSDAGLRYYEWNGEHLMSVTSLRRVVGMSIQLHNWAIGQVADAALDARHSAELFKATDDEYRKAVRAAGTLKRDLAAALGTSVHEAAAQGTRASALPDEDERKPFLAKYHEAMSDMNWKPVVNEAQVFNLSQRYAGSLDLIVYDNERNDYVLVDLKTGKGVYPDAALQLDMYRRAEFCGGYDPIEEKDVVDEEATEFLKAVDRMGVLHLRPEGWEWLPITISAELSEAAAHMMMFAQWVEKYPDLSELIELPGAAG